MKAYKSMESYNYFVCGWVSEFLIKILEENNRLIFAKVSLKTILICKNLFSSQYRDICLINSQGKSFAKIDCNSSQSLGNHIRGWRCLDSPL